MGGHDHGHHREYKVPDWRIYKVEDSPELKAIQQALATQGLKDPWLRNEVWRYVGDFRYDHMPVRGLLRILSRGFKYGLAAAIVTAAVEKVLINKFGSHGEDHH